jgi:hypothetical protein
MERNEYETFVYCVEIEKDELKVIPEKMALNVTLAMKDALKKLQTEKQPYGDYKILSHSTVLLGKHLTLSFLCYLP